VQNVIEFRLVVSEIKNLTEEQDLSIIFSFQTLHARISVGVPKDGNFLQHCCVTVKPKYDVAGAIFYLVQRISVLWR
jgi:hypothetical protein